MPIDRINDGHLADLARDRRCPVLASLGRRNPRWSRLAAIDQREIRTDLQAFVLV
jgi:hypothetical protein